MESENKKLDINSLRIDREKRASSRILLSKAMLIVLIPIVVFIGLVLLFPNFIPFFAPEVLTSKAILMTPSQASTVLTSSGYVVARKKAEVSPKAVGRIAWINLEEGQRVKAGELVARLESDELEAQKLEILSNLENARKEMARQSELFSKGITSQQSYDNAKTRVRVLEAQLRNIDELIKNTMIYSPIDGVVTVKKAFLGETVTPQGFGGAGSAGATFAVIVDLDSLEVDTDINESNLGKLTPGMPAEVILDAYPDRTYEGRLRQIVPTADRQKGTFKVKVEFINKDDNVMPEMSCRINFLDPNLLGDNTEKPRIVIPASALIGQDGEEGVFVVNSNRVQFQPVDSGYKIGTQIQIKEGLTGGEQLVIEANGLKLKDGDRVRIKSE